MSYPLVKRNVRGLRLDNDGMSDTTMRLMAKYYNDLERPAVQDFRPNFAAIHVYGMENGGLSALIGNTVFDVRPPASKGGDFIVTARDYFGQRALNKAEKSALLKGVQHQLKTREVKMIGGHEVTPNVPLMRWIFPDSAKALHAFARQLKG